MKTNIRQIPGVQCELGEGLLWNDARQRLMMTDILCCKVLEVEIDCHEVQVWTFAKPVGWILPSALASTFLLGLKSGVHAFRPGESARVTPIERHFPGAPHCRLNDACADSTGRIWYGSMNDHAPEQADGQLASFSAQEGLRLHDHGFSVTNGPLVSPDGCWLYLNDSLRGIVYRYALSLHDGQLSGRHIFHQFTAEEGYPDGMCFDTDGRLWIALWGGARVVCLNADGALVDSLAVPAPFVTNVCFCGEALDRMIVSTARTGMPAEALAQYPKAGGLFEITRLGVRGYRSHRVTMDPAWT